MPKSLQAMSAQLSPRKAVQPVGCMFPTCRAVRKTLISSFTCDLDSSGFSPEADNEDVEAGSGVNMRQ